MITHDVSEALGRALDAIDNCSMRYALVDGLAVSAWAIPRATRDADMWVELGNDRSTLEAALREAALREAALREAALREADFDVPAMAEELNRFGVFRSKDGATGVFIDIFDAVGPLGKAILEHRIQGRLGDVDVWIARANERLARALREAPES